ncbi:MAG: tail fiber domain-containing protein [Pseudomonas sp.]|uniref:tail fiber domain-containing protein n=1 Tax=Pseudomonas sp. TaxID=306 RepID=UPI003BB714DB
MKIYRKYNQWGASLLEVIVALVLGVVLIGGMVLYISSNQSQIAIQNDAQVFSQFAQAAEKYIQANQAALLAGTFTASGSGVTVTPGGVTVSADRLRSDLFLSNGIKNMLGKQNQDISLLIRITSAGSATASLQGMLLSHGGDSYRESELGQLTKIIGATAGFVDANSSGNLILGLNRGWSSPVSDWNFAGAVLTPRTGHVMALINTRESDAASGNLNADEIVHRKTVPANPNLNTMNTGLTVNGTLRRLYSADAFGITVENSRLPRGQDFKFNNVNIGNFTSQADFSLNGSARIDPGGAEGPLLPTAYTYASNLEVKLLYAPKSTVSASLLEGPSIITSDQSLKSNIQPIRDSLNKINQLSGYTFRWNETGKPDMGVVAQEVNDVFPALVSRDEDGKLMVRYQNLLAPLIEASKELHQIIISMGAKVQGGVGAQDDLQQIIEQLAQELNQQNIEFVQLKYSAKQVLTDEERVLCGVLCER